MGEKLSALNIAKLRIKMLFYSTKNIITLFIFPLVLIYLIGFIYSPQTLKQIPIAVVDEDLSEYSQSLISLVKDHKILDVTVTSEEEARELVRRNRIEGAYIIKEGFEEFIRKDANPKIIVLKSAAAIGADGISEIVVSGVIRLQSNARAANIVINEYGKREFLRKYNKEQLWQEVFDASESYWYPEQLMKLEHKQVNSDTILGDEPTGVGITQFSAGPIGIILMFLALSLGYVFSMLHKEKKQGTLKRLYLVSSGKRDILLGYIFSMVLLLIVQSYFLILISNQVFKISFEVSHLLLSSVIFLYCIYISSIVLSIAIGINSSSPWNNYYALTVVITSMIGGSFWSIELLSEPLKKIALLTPQGLTLQILRLARLGEVRLVLLYCILMLLISCMLFVYSRKKLSYIMEEEV